MKIEGIEYKLKKEIITPEETIPVGTVFDFFSGIGESFDYDYRVVKSEVEDFNEWFEEVKPEQPKRWRAEKGEYYWTLDDKCNVTMKKESGSLEDFFAWKSGIYCNSPVQAAFFKAGIVMQYTVNKAMKGFIGAISSRIDKPEDSNKTTEKEPHDERNL